MDDLELDEKPELNITPLVDIMLVLLAILMVTTPAITYKEDINLPDGSKSQKAELNPPLSVRIDKNKMIYIDKDVYKYADFKENFSSKASRYDKSRAVYIYADKGLLYGDVVPIFAELKKQGFSKVSLGTK